MKFTTKIEIEKEIKNLLAQAEKAILETNFEKRIVHSKIELFKLDLNEITEKVSHQNNDITDDVSKDDVGGKMKEESNHEKLTITNGENEKYTVELDKMIPKLKLLSVKREKQWYFTLDALLRLSTSWLALIYGGWLCIIAVCLSPIDSYLVTNNYIRPNNQINILIRRFIGMLVLISSGIEYDMSYIHDKTITANNASLKLYDHMSLDELFGALGSCIISYTHASTMDAFLISTIPPGSLALCKQELFLIPFFAWMLNSWGGIPINRNNRHSAMKSLEYAISTTKNHEVIQIAPEGTRSVTGNMISFKKGPFYMWESLDRIPIVPMVIMGAFELYPPGSNLSHCGKVYCHYLTPITDQSLTREEVSNQLRRQMLTHIIEHSPKDISSDISMKARCLCYAVVVLVHGLNMLVINYFYHYAIKPYVQETMDHGDIHKDGNEHKTTIYWAIFHAYLKLFGVVVLISLINYVYCVYIKTNIKKAVQSDDQNTQKSKRE